MYNPYVRPTYLLLAQKIEYNIFLIHALRNKKPLHVVVAFMTENLHILDLI